MVEYYFFCYCYPKQTKGLQKKTTIETSCTSGRVQLIWCAIETPLNFHNFCDALWGRATVTTAWSDNDSIAATIIVCG